VLFYPAALHLSTPTLNRVAALIRAHRKTIGSRWRVLEPGAQALLTLAYLHKGERLRDLAAGFGISAATAWRRTRETITLLATRAPGIKDALHHAKRAGAAFVILDGTLAHIDRNQTDRPYYSGKHKRHGMNLQAIADHGLCEISTFGTLVRFWRCRGWRVARCRGGGRYGRAMP